MKKMIIFVKLKRIMQVGTESFKGVESDNICKLVEDWTLGRILNITYMIILLNNQKKELVIAYLKKRMVKLFFLDLSKKYQSKYNKGQIAN